MFAIKTGFGSAAASQRQYANRTLNRHLHTAKFHNPRAYPRAARFKSTTPAVPKSGHIEEGPNESLLFIDNIFPLRLSFLLCLTNLPFFTDPEKILQRILKQLHDDQRIPAADPINIAERALPDSISLSVKQILPRLKEGGAYAKLLHDSKISPPDIESALQEYLEKTSPKPWFNPFRSVGSHLVRGRPWLEDLQRYPSQKLRVEFLPTGPGAEAAELPEETLYTLFRTYGKLGDIKPQPTGSKDLPKYATLYYGNIRDAIMAKNCMHGFVLPESEGGGKNGTVLKMVYEKRTKARFLRDWIMNHPRIVIPIVAAIVASVTVAIFDPVRTFFIKTHITHTFHLTENKVYSWFRSQLTRANEILSFKRHEGENAGMSVVWDDRRGDIEQIRTWLMETADTFIVVQGPRGSGKRELVLDEALKGRRNTLHIDCKPIQEARGDSSTIFAAAREVGYRPIFSWMNTFSSMIDLAAQGTIGTKTGFSETLDSQLQKIWQNTTNALKELALEGRSKDDKDSELGDDEYLEAHPERRPVVVIDNFLHKSQESNIVYDKISEWAASLTTGNVAHVIFLTNDVSFSKSLSKALPDRVFRQVSLGDCSPEVAKRFVVNHLNADADEGSQGEKKSPPSESRQDLGELDGCIDILGGRLTDLEFLARRIKTGETPNKAVQQIIDQSASEILKMYILDIGTSSGNGSSRSWTPEQAWLLIKSLATTPSLRYNELLLSDTFKSSDGALLALEQFELITIVSQNGRPHSIKPGKPVYQAAFKQLVADRVLKARLDLAVLTQLIGIETKGIDKAEAELALLGGLPGQPREVKSRVKWLLAKMQSSQGKVEGWEKEGKALKEVLAKEY
ncbi:MAG: hypothetical protein LQ349_008561 [Xanthoria aureola]|nr:MAG: hypothetical protein LQ349_008561 [Xanthoria aureola]